MLIIKKIYFLIITFKSFFFIFILLSINLGILNAIADFSNPNVDKYVINMYKNNFNLNEYNKTYNNIYYNIDNKEEIIDNKEKINYGFIQKISINIPNIGIYQDTFLMKIGDYKKALDAKIDKDLINFELNNFFNIDDGFLIWGHSSGYWWDYSERKNIFKDLPLLKKGNFIFLEIETTNGKFIKKYTIYDVKIGSNIKVNKTDKVIFTCYPVNTSKERIVFFLK